jgi:hypothetical protein
MRAGRIVALVLGILLLLPALGLVFGGVGVLLAHHRAGDDGFFDHDLEQLDTSTFAFTAPLDDVIDLTDAPQWVLDRLDIDVRVAVTAVAPTEEVFVGVADSDDVAAYLQGAAHTEVSDVEGSRVTTQVAGAGAAPGAAIDPPTDQGIWTTSASGPGTQVVRWPVDNRSRTVVVMNADGTAGVRVDPAVGVRVGFLTPLGITLLLAGLVLLAVALVLIVVVALVGNRRDRARAPSVTGRGSGPPPGPGGPPTGYAPVPPYGQQPPYWGPPSPGPPYPQQPYPQPQPPTDRPGPPAGAATS